MLLVVIAPLTLRLATAALAAVGPAALDELS
jgi:hypothetical protein